MNLMQNLGQKKKIAAYLKTFNINEIPFNNC